MQMQRFVSLTKLNQYKITITHELTNKILTSHNIQIYDGKCLHYVDWLVETRPSFSPPRRDMRLPDADPGATEVFTQRLDELNRKFEKLLELLSQRLKTAVEVGGVDGLVSRFVILIIFCDENKIIYTSDSLNNKWHYMQQCVKLKVHNQPKLSHEIQKHFRQLLKCCMNVTFIFANLFNLHQGQLIENSI